MNNQALQTFIVTSDDPHSNVWLENELHLPHDRDVSTVHQQKKRRFKQGDPAIG